MPSALEKIVKILKLERDRGGDNSAMVGGLGKFAVAWEVEARGQAKRPQHHILIDEIVDSLREYEAIADEEERLARVNHLLNRATNREPPPPAYRARLAEWEKKMPAQTDRRRGTRGERHTAQYDRRQGRGPGGRRRPGHQHFDSASWDEDFTGGPREWQLDLPELPTLARPPRAPGPERSRDEQRDLLRALEAPTTEVKGVGRKFAELLEAMDIRTVRDMLFRFPRDHRDYTEQTCIRDLDEGETATVIGTVQSARVVWGQRGGDLVITITDGSGYLSARFFGQPRLQERMRAGKQIALQGKVGFFRDLPQMANPEWEELDLANLKIPALVPIYRMTQGLRPRHYRRTMKTLVDEWAAKIPDPLPRAVLERADLADLGWALRQAHFPEGRDHLRHAERRLAIAGLLTLQLAMLGKRREWQASPAPPFRVSENFTKAFVESAFPYALTDDQQRALREISRDLAQPLPMNRLLQGDVGVGKTAVAIVCLALAYANGKQAAIMAPTSILAEQHCRVVSQAFERLQRTETPVIALLTSALSSGERESIYRGVADGSIDIVIGTHAIVQEGLEFQDLGLAIIDEQQRFGVEQRARLRGKGQNPHLLVMTATPIPRTLALTLHADLDLSVIAEHPPGIPKVKTKIIDPVARERLNGYVINQLEAGRQAFFAHPLVDESEAQETAAATEAYERLSQVFFRFRVCLLHGRMSAGEKEAIMADFAAGKTDVMVTTSVAEVGVDVPNATIMVIDGANRFGLAQLHQFRGRLRRGEHESFCYLLPDQSESVSLDRIRAAQAGELDHEKLSIAERRLAALEETDDGFKLAELDWRLRGAGELLGTRQSGPGSLPPLDKISTEWLAEAQQEARAIFEEDSALEKPEHQLLAEGIRLRYGEAGELS